MATATKTFSWLNGMSILYAGTPLDTNGKIANNASAVGIVQENVYMPNKTATILTSGSWDERIGRANGIVLTDACKRALKDIRFTEEVTELPAPAAADAGKFVKVNSAGTAYEAVKVMAEAVAPAESGTEVESINAIITALVNAGLMEEYEEPEADPEEE